MIQNSANKRPKGEFFVEPETRFQRNGVDVTFTFERVRVRTFDPQYKWRDDKSAENQVNQKARKTLNPHRTNQWT